MIGNRQTRPADSAKAGLQFRLSQYRTARSPAAGKAKQSMLEESTAGATSLDGSGEPRSPRVPRTPAGGSALEPSFSPRPDAVFDAVLGDEETEPADPCGAVGPKHLFVMLNSGFTIRRREDGRELRSGSLEKFWGQNLD